MDHGKNSFRSDGTSTADAPPPYTELVPEYPPQLSSGTPPAQSYVPVHGYLPPSIVTAQSYSPQPYPPPPQHQQPQDYPTQDIVVQNLPPVTQATRPVSNIS